MTEPTNATYSLENAKSQMRKGFLEFPVLLLIATESTYAPDILTSLKKANLLVVEGTIYPLLSRLRKFNLVTYCWEESKSGPPRKMYTITDKGKVVVEELQTSFKEFTTSINSLIKNYEKNN